MHSKTLITTHLNFMNYFFYRYNYNHTNQEMYIVENWKTLLRPQPPPSHKYLPHIIKQVLNLFTKGPDNFSNKHFIPLAWQWHPYTYRHCQFSYQHCKVLIIWKIVKVISSLWWPQRKTMDSSSHTKIQCNSI